MMDWGKFLFSFEGRISRKAYWIYFLVSLALGFLIQGLAIGTTGLVADPEAMPAIPMWYWLIQIPLLWIGLAVMAKRWHDQDRSGWFTLLLFIPLLGFLIVLVMLGFIGSTPGPNRFGDGPMV